MKLGGVPRGDLRLLAPGLLALALAITLATVLAVALLRQSQHGQQAQRVHTQELDDLRQQLAQTRRHADWLARHAAEFRALQVQNLLEHEHRLHWLEQLDALQLAQPALQLRYSIAARRIVSTAPGEGEAALMASAMTLNYLARDEEDFSRVHARLQALPGRLLPRQCRLARQAASGFTVSCRYDWLTIAPLPPSGATP
ncbi:hypothetical protein [Chitinilyticum litopenaei]|uniref:hypothetical protein n=1 Tax=Chitinilyticum litopenaei TaxID=1121276 RepID=UPI0004239363|nr:hypothetical protein [Chitinilyticum litopenaei]